jgi:hypothetical protein
MNAAEIWQKIKPHAVRDLLTSNGGGSGSVPGGLTAHALNGPYHTGPLDRSQATWVAMDINSALATHVAAPDPHSVYLKKAGDAMTGVLGLADGTAGAPSLSFANSATTGIYRQAADALSIVTAGAERLRVNATGQAALNGAPLTGYAMTHRPATGQTGGFTLEGTYDTAGFLFNTSAIVRHAAQTTAQVFRWAPTAEPQGALSNLLNLNTTLRLDNSSSNITNLRLNQGQLLGQTNYTGTIINLSMFHALNASLGGATVTNQYGYYCAPLSGATLNYAFYAAGTTPSYFGGTIYANTDIEVSGEVLVDAGTAGAPSVAGLIDTNTGVNLPGGDIVALVAGGTVAVNVGPTGAAVGTAFDTTAALKVQSAANDDITLFLKQKSGQTARMWRVEDSAGQELIVLDSQGNLQSGNPGFVSGLTGWQITPIGNAELNNAFIRGELHASIFVMDEFHASGGTLYIAPAGKLELDATVYTTTGIEAVFDIRTTSVSGSGSQFDIRTTSVLGSGSQFTLRTIENFIELTDPPSGHAMILSPGDRIRCKALGLSVGIDLWDVWGIVTAVADMTTHFRYYYTRTSGGTNGLIIPAGTAIISYGPPGAGRIYLTADQQYAPYMQVFLSGEEPWNGQITPTVRIGRLDGVGLPGVSGIEQHGIVLSSNLNNASAPYMVASNLKMRQYKIDSEWNNGNPTARITADGEFRLGTNVDADNSTGLKFNPTTGALDIGNASYPGAVNVRGVITVTGGSGIAAFTDANLDNIANGATYGRINNTIIGGGFIRVGSGNKDSTLSGWFIDAGEIVGQAAGVDQVVLNTSGKITAGGSTLDSAGLTMLTDTTDVHSSQLDSRAVSFARSGQAPFGRLTSYYLSATTTYGVDIYGRSPASEKVFARFGAEQASALYGGGAAGAPRVVAYSDAAGAGDFLRIYANTEIGLYRSGSATPDLSINSGGIVANTDLDMNGYNIVDANNTWAIRSTAPL